MIISYALKYFTRNTALDKLNCYLKYAIKIQKLLRNDFNFIYFRDVIADIIHKIIRIFSWNAWNSCLLNSLLNIKVLSNY